MTAPITEPDVYFDGPAGDTPLDAAGMNRIWAALMQALLDQLVPRQVSDDATANIRDMLLVDASNGPVHLQAPQAVDLGQWGARKVDSSSNQVVIETIGADVLDEHGRTSWTLVSQDDDAIFSFAGPGSYVLWREHTTSLPATADRLGPIKISGDLTGTWDNIRLPGKENTGVAASLLDTHTHATDPHGDRAAAQQNAGAQILAHTQASDPHGDRAWTQSQYVPLSWFDQSGQLLSSHIPAIAISNTFPVATQAAQLALTAQVGDVAVRTDQGKTYILAGADPTQLSNWTELPSIGKVASVNGQQGSVVLGSTDVGAAPLVHASRHYPGGPDDLSTQFVSWGQGNIISGFAQLDGAAKVPAAQLPGATAGALGGIQLGGDIAGTAAAPTVPGKEATGVANSLVTTHKNAVDPHGDRAYAAGLVSAIHQVPAGGATGYALVKQSGNDFDYVWGAVGVSTNVQQDLKVVSVKNYGAVGDGTTDDTTSIRNAIGNTPAGGVCYFPPGNYGITGPLTVPPQITLEGAHTETLTYAGAAPIATSIKLLAAFIGLAGVRFLDKQAGAYSVSAVGQKLRRITVDATAAPTGTKGVQVFGFVREATLDYVTVRAAKDNGFDFSVNASGTDGTNPQSNRILHCVADNCTGAGFSVANMPDSTFLDCNAQGSGWVGFYLAGLMNGMLIGCRAEWSTQYGFYITSGFWGTGKGSGGMEMFGCLTDRNNYDGVRVDATGSSEILINGLVARRDGRNNNAGAGNYAAVCVTGSTMPVLIDGLVTQPGVDDNSANTTTGNSPQFGVRVLNSTHVAVGGASYVAAQQAPFSDGGGNGLFYRGPGIGTAVGATDALVRSAPAAATPMPEPVNVVAASGAAQTLPDMGTATIHDVTLTAGCTFTFPTAAAGKSFTVVLRQDGTGGRAVTWPGAVLWPGGVLPTRSTGANAVDVFTFVASGTAWIGSMAARDVK